MLLSGLCQEIDEVSGRFGRMVVAIGAINGTWRSFAGLGLAKLDDEAVAYLAAGDVSYCRMDPVLAADVRRYLEDFIHENGDLKVAVFEGGRLHDFIDVNVDQEIGEDGEDVNVMIVQAYVMKASPKTAR
jgi:hypothetical protein